MEQRIAERGSRTRQRSETAPLSHTSIELLMQFLKHNALFLVLLLIAVAVYSIFVLPWLQDIGHTGLSVAGYAIFALLLVYGRANRRRRVRTVTERRRGI